VEFYIRGIAFYGAEICALRKVNQKYLERFERKGGGISWADLVKNEEALYGFNNNNNNNNNNITGNHDVKELQKTATLGTAHIIRKVLT
jgi:hypothetical protein